MEPTDIAHLAGVFDAVGSVTVHVTKNQKYSLGYQYQPLVRLHRPPDHEALLGKFSAYADDQGVRYHISEKSHGGDRTSQSYEFVVNDAESIRRFLAPMMPFLVTNLEPADIMLGQVLPAIEADDHRSKHEFVKLMGPADRLREATQKGADPKYTQAYFEDEWNIEVSE